MPSTLPQRQNDEIDRCLAGRGGHDPGAIYCYDARRLGERDGKQMHRSIFISNLVQRRNPYLYAYFEKETTVTFYFSPRREDAISDEGIIRRFAIREGQKLKL